jgi:hypothetical protein
MTKPEPDTRSPERRARDERIAAEPKLPIPELPPDAPTAPVEEFLRRLRRPLALRGVVENGVIRLTDPDAKLPEHAQVIVVAAE